MTAHDVGEVDRETRDALNELGALNRVALLQMNAANVYINGVTSMFPKLKNFFVSFSVVSMLTVAFFLFANFVCGLLSQAFPTLMLESHRADNKRVQHPVRRAPAGTGHEVVVNKRAGRT